MSCAASLPSLRDGASPGTASQPRCQPGGPHGIDPVIGQGANAPGEQKYRKVWDDATSAIVNNAPFAGFVKMRGGEYFFSPSLSFLRSL